MCMPEPDQEAVEAEAVSREAQNTLGQAHLKRVRQAAAIRAVQKKAVQAAPVLPTQAV